MSGGRCLAIAVLLLALSVVAQAEVIPVPLTEDESVLSDVGSGDGTASTGYPTRNQYYKFVTGTGYTSELKKGLLTGVFYNGTGYLRSRFYLKFNLPEIAPDEYIESAILTGCYERDPHATDKDHNFYHVENDNWHEGPPNSPPPQPVFTTDPLDGITWNNQPLLTPTAPALGTFKPGDYTPGSFPWPWWNITSTVRNEYSGNRILSLMFKAVDESFDENNQNGEYFYEREGCPCHFTLDLDVRPIPSPSVLVGLLSMGVTGGLVFGYRRWRHLPAE